MNREQELKNRVNYVIKFTEIYRSFSAHQIEERELAILRHQIPYMFLKPEPDDIVTGRMKYPPLVFAPQGQAPQGGFGYIYDSDKFSLLMKEEGIEEEQRKNLEKIRKFWEREDTAFKTRESYPEEISRWLPSDNWTGEAGAAFPLYRMSGSQMDLGKLVKLGIPGLKHEIELRRSLAGGREAILLDAMSASLDLFSELCLFYRDQTRNLIKQNPENAGRLAELVNALENIAFRKPTNFLEAVQLIHLYVLVSGSNNYGRLDIALAPSYFSDRYEKGKDEEYFISVLESFFRLINFRGIIWDGRVIIGGRDRKEINSEKELDILIMEACRRVHDVLPQLTLRCYKHMDDALLKKAWQLIGEGNPYPMLYNDDVNLPAATRAFKVDEETSQDCIPFGCGEYVLYHKSFGTPSGVINLLKILEITLRKGVDPLTGKNLGTDFSNRMEIQSFEDLYEAYSANVDHYMNILAFQEKHEYEIAGKTAPFLFMSMLFDDCIQRAKAMFDGGVRYLGGTIETYGNTNTADSLYVIREEVFRKKKYSLKELTDILDKDFKGNEKVRKEWIDLPKYGNNHREADEMMQKVHTDVCLSASSKASKAGLDSYLVVNINNSANTILGKFTAASADGRKSGEGMANGNTPSPGRDLEGITALLSSLVKMPVDIHAGASQNIKFSKEMFREKIQHTHSLIQAYFSMGGAQLMITCVGREDLENALKEPEKYSNLIVRVGGFSARFIELDREVQMEILNRTLY